MRKVWLTQCLCGSLNRHCIMAGAQMADSHEEAVRIIETPLRLQIEAAIQMKFIDPWCGLCRASPESWIYETRRSKFATLEEAMPVLLEQEQQQRLTAVAMSWTSLTENEPNESN